MANDVKAQLATAEHIKPKDLGSVKGNAPHHTDMRATNSYESKTTPAGAGFDVRILA